MVETLKTIHLLAMAFGIGGGLVNLLLSVRLRGHPAMADLVGFMTWVARGAYLSLVLLWVTGIWLLSTLHSSPESLGAEFWGKITAALVLTIAATSMQAAALGLLPAGLVTPPRRLALGITGTLSSVVAVILAVLTFG